ncbi:DEAD/DEAH box helicase [Candidatus Cetobacterium colombiensis]|uniref:DEAD/DEAH box helicase n=1 Tax=Candidatus Cetobacterium colombiensis TaxID=3073100 RepID=A0ABU4WFJ9_9FUSO|nr:DEAD/DEAH box helicase [Candidatus Cetobacterium colombiensis]MDX8337165.1 DEAD/DEAH box helicase [Candidatus Cetobacterium colombiensis]
MDFLKKVESEVDWKLYNRGKDYYMKGRLFGLNLYEGPEYYEETTFSLEGKVRGSGNQIYNTKILFSEDEIYEEECDCMYYEENWRTCKHIVALSLVAYYSVLKNRVTKENTVDLHLDFLKNVATEKKNPIFLKVTPKIDNLMGILDFSIDMEIVTKEKNYKLMSKFIKFLDAYEKESFSFGKSYTYNPATDYFQGWEKDFFEFFKEYEELMESTYYGGISITEILNNKRSFDRFIDILAKGKQVVLKEASLKELLNIELKEEKENNICLDFKNAHTYIIKGERTLLDPLNPRNLIFYRITKEEMEFYKKLLQRTSRSKEMVISENNLSLVVNSIQKMGKLSVAKNLKEKVYTPKNIEDKIYIDSYNTYGLKVHSKRFYDGKSESELKDVVILSDSLEAKSLYHEVLKRYQNNFESGAYHLTDIENIYRFVMEAIPELEKKYELYYSEEFKNKSYLTASYRVETKVSDILDISFNIDGIDKNEVVNFLNAVREKKKYFLLKNGGIIDIGDGKELDELNDLLDISEASKKEIEAGVISRAKNYSYFLSSTLKKIKGVVLDEGFKALDKNLKSLTKKKEEKLVKESFPMLRDYQLYGVQWLMTLRKLGLGGILADDMGLGKTLQTIAYLALEERELPSVVVAPKSLVYNWLSEFKKFAPNVVVKMCIGTKKEREDTIKNLKPKEILITTYGVLKNDIEIYKELPFESGFANIVIDEAQNIKNILGKTSSAIKEIVGETKIALTGTPIENNILELWSIFDFAFPGYLGKHTTFKKRYLDNLKNLKSVVGPFILRRVKSEVLKELPEKIEQDVVVELGDKQKKLYLGYLEKYKREVEADGSDAIKILSCLTRLRQICNHPKLFIEDYKGESGKLDALLEILQEAKSGGHRVLLFSQFTEMLSIIKEHLKDEFNTLYLDGKTKVSERLELVERFNGGEGDVFIISLKAGGSGLNLTGADTVIHFDPWWNPSVENQATDRAHRMGQKNVVNVFRLITKGTIEEKINLIKGEKSKVISEVLDGEKTELLKMNKEELLKLF